MRRPAQRSANAVVHAWQPLLKVIKRFARKVDGLVFLIIGDPENIVAGEFGAVGGLFQVVAGRVIAI